MRVRRGFLKWGAAIGSAGAIALVGCAIVKEKLGNVAPEAAKGDVAQLTTVAGVTALAGVKMSPEARALIAAATPLAVKALETLAAAWARHAAEKREADAREEELRRLQTAQAQIFYADLCTQKGTAPEARASGAAPAVPGSLASKEKEAEAAFAAGDYARAASLLQTVYDEKKRVLGEQHPELARVENKLAVAYLSAGDEVHAVVLAVQALEVRKQRLAEAERAKPEFKKVLTASLDVAESETTVAHIYRSSSAFDEAKKNYQHALQVRTQHLGKGHLCAAQSQNNLGELYYLTGAYAPAMELYQKALATREKHLPDDHRDRAQSYNNLGSLHRAIALYEPAKRYYERALANRRRLGENHPEVADSYHHFASLYRAMGDFSQAEAFYERALDIRKARFKDGIEVAETETSLAELYFSYGDYARAGTLLEHAHGIRKARLPADHPALAESLADLAKVHEAKLEYARAEENDHQALAIWEKTFGAEHPAVASAVAQLGELYLAQGKLDEAESSFVRARDIRREKLGADHPSTAESLHDLATVHYARHDYARAEPLFRSALDIRRKKLGESHPAVATSLSYLAALLVATGRPDEALQALRQAQLISEQLVGSIGMVAGEARLDAILRSLRAQEELVYSLLAEKDLAPRAAPLALSVALMRKGRSVDQAASLSRTVYLGLDGERREKFDELRTMRAQIARQKLSPSGGGSAEDMKKLAEKAELLEEELAKHSAAIRARKDTPGLLDVVEKVAAALPPSTALVEVVRYRAYQFKAKPREPRWGGLRYSAMVLDGKGAAQVADLGPAGAIDEQVRVFLGAVTDHAGPAGQGELDKQPEKASQELDRLVLQPIRPFLAKSRGIVLSPDGQLNLLPFGALFDGKEYLIDVHELTYVTSGRDLLPRPAMKRSREVVLLARPAFVKGSAPVTHQDGAAARGLDVIRDPKPSMLQTPLASGALKLRSPPSPLPGTEEEARLIHELIPSSRVFLGRDATKERFLGLRAPRILHVATHGLFRPEPSADRGNARGLETTGGLLAPVAATALRSEPLLNSMLLWADVGVPLTDGDGTAVVLEPSGLATALEVAGMNLWGTQLVVLSACDTGRGQVDDLGQGVYGLRRAVMVAGAETLVTSLWKVDDAVTRDLMTAYYRKLLAGAGRGEALRQASLMVRKKHPEPRYWAPFIAIGQVGPVKGIR